MSKPSGPRQLMSRTELYLHACMMIVLVIGITFGFAARTTIGNDWEAIQSGIQDCRTLLAKERELEEAGEQVVRRKDMTQL